MKNYSATKKIAGAFVVVIILAAIAFLMGGCSTYGHYEEPKGPGGIDRAPEEGPPDEYVCPPDGKTGPGWCNGKCDPATECCPIVGSCKPLGCADGFVCMSSKCINVLTLINRSK